MNPSESGNQYARITQRSANALEAEARLERDGIAVFSEVFFPGWEAFVATDGGEFRPHAILRTNRSMRGILLPAGQHQIKMRYRPAAFRTGAAITGIAVTGLLLLLLASRTFGKTMIAGRQVDVAE